jgi:hypothetical protein
MSKLRVLVACEYSGAVRRALRARGIDAVSCDLLPSEDNSPHHIIGDVRPLLRERWAMVIAHPTCRFLAHSGLRWLYQGGRRYNDDGTENPIDPVRWGQMIDGCAFYAECWNANSDCVAVENSDLHPYAKAELRRLGVPIDMAQLVQPWWFATDEDDNVKKGAHLVFRGLRQLAGNGMFDGSTARAECHLASPGPDRWKERSRTRPSVAEAFADQWGAILAGDQA